MATKKLSKKTTRKTKTTKKTDQRGAPKLARGKSLTKCHAIACNQVEYARILSAAYERGVTVSELLRHLVLPHFPEVEPKPRRYCGVDRAKMGKGE